MISLVIPPGDQVRLDARVVTAALLLVDAGLWYFNSTRESL